MIMLCPYLSFEQASNLGGLSPGDKIPVDITVQHILNYRQTSVRLADIHKPLLLDFFETHCSGCIETLSYLNKIQKQLQGSLQVLVVCTEPDDKISKFLRNNPRVKDISLPFITGDTILQRLFPHVYIPHEVWLDKTNIVQAITSSDYLNKENIESLVAGKPLYLPLKNDTYEYDTGKPLVENAGENKVDILYQSTVTGFLNNAPTGLHGDRLTANGTSTTVYFINMLPLSICRAALGYRDMPNRFILNVKDLSALIHSGNNLDWFKRYALCYEISVPVETPSWQLENHILHDIGEAARLRIRIVKREMPCYVLVTDSSNRQKDPQTKGGVPASSFFSENGKQAFMQNEPLGRLIIAMNSGTFGKTSPIVVDDTGLRTCVDMTFGLVSVKNISAMRKVLQAYGFNIIKQLRLLEMVVITDINIQNK